MTLKETLETNYKSSLKSKNKMEISTYRLILSSIKDLVILNRSGANKKEIDDEAMARAIEQRKIEKKKTAIFEQKAIVKVNFFYSFS